MEVRHESARTVCLVFALGVMASVAEEGNGVIRLSSPVLQLGIEQRGGHLVDMRLTGHDLNPFSWQLTRETMPQEAHPDAVYKGHFLCMGRTGKPSPGEIRAGVPMRGEQTGKIWTITAQGDRDVEMTCAAPLDGLKVYRRVELYERAPCFFVEEAFENTGALGRVHNILQHGTIGPPFLSEKTLINSNAKQGFCHKFEYPDPHRFEYGFPNARLDESGSETTDLRVSSDPLNYLSRHLADTNAFYGWATAYDPVSGLVLGYVWKTSDYPWINFWQQVREGRLVAKGLEFGTAGVNESYQRLLEADARFHGIPSWEYIDAGEIVEKSYLCFLMEIGTGAENPAVQIDDDRLTLNGKIDIPNPFVE